MARSGFVLNVREAAGLAFGYRDSLVAVMVDCFFEIVLFFGVWSRKAFFFDIRASFGGAVLPVIDFVVIVIIA